MALNGTVALAPPGVMGFDTTQMQSRVSISQYYNKGFRFCIRYIAHTQGSSSVFQDITSQEAQVILDAGMALMVVQHPLKEGWQPTAALGKQYGQAAAFNAGAADLLEASTVWLDLEGVKSGAAPQDVVDFCNAWFDEVSAVGFDTGVYIGASPGLSAEQLYWDLKTKHYWRGGSSVKSGVPDDIPNRGYQLTQRISNPNTPSEFDSDVTQNDKNGGGVAWIVKSAGLVA